MNTSTLIAPPALVRRAEQHDTKAIQALDAWHARTGCYTQIASQIDPTQKIKLMRETMALALSASK